MSTESDISCSQNGFIYTIAFNRPEKKNALTKAMYLGLVQEFRRVRNDPSVRVILLCGAENNFSAGNDIQDFLEGDDFDNNHPAFQFLFEISTCPLPIVAAVQGHAIGVGATMLLHCDFVYAGESSRFRFPFVDLGLVPEGGSTLLLPVLAGFPLANELLMLGEAFDSQTAYRARMVNQVVADAEVLSMAQSSAEKLARKEPKAMRETKRLLRDPWRDPVRRTLEGEGRAFFERLQGEAAQKALSKFLQAKPGN